MKTFIMLLFGNAALTPQALDNPLAPIAAKLEPMRTAVYRTVGDLRAELARQQRKKPARRRTE